jgi:Mrp family chromosome partitioning ATPase
LALKAETTMSRNFEFLQQLEVELGPQEAFPSGLPASSVPEVTSGRDERRNSVAVDLNLHQRAEYLKLVRRLFLEQTEGTPRSVVFAGIDDGSGSSRICASVAEVLAVEVRENVCVVDANPQSSLWSQLVARSDHRAVAADLLQKGSVRDLAKQLQPENLWFLACRALTADGLLGSAPLRARFLELRNEFEYVLVDVQPVALDSTSALLAPLTDGVVLVVEANSTRREVARKVKEAMESAHVRLLGAVLNNRTFPIPEVIYRSL